MAGGITALDKTNGHEITGTQTAADSKKHLDSAATLYGTTDSGNRKALNSTVEGHLEVAVHGPRLPFGSIHTEKLTPVFQTDAIYGLNTGQTLTGTTETGSVSSTNSLFTCSTGTTIYASAFVQSRKRLRYRAGQGIVGRFSALYTTGVASSYQVAGFGHAEDGVYFGYKDTNFGILYNHHGLRETRTLTVSAAAGGAGNVTITLNGTAYVVAMSAAATTIARTVWELAKATYAGWSAQPNGAGTEVVFVADSVGAKSGTYSVSGLSLAGSFAQNVAGQAVTEDFIAQSSWNGDVLDGTGATGATLDPTKLNVYQIGIQYLGAGAITFQIEVSSSGDNNSEFITVHTIKLPNTLTQTSFSNPSFPFTMSAYSAGSTTDLTIKVGSFAGFIEGEKKLHGNRFSYLNSTTAGNATTIVPLLTIYNARYFGGRANQSVINFLSVNGAIKSSAPAVFYVIKNGTLTGNLSFNEYASGLSCSLLDTAATQVTYTSDQLIWTGHLGETGQLDHGFSEGGMDELTLQPGEYVTLGIKSASGNIQFTTASLNTREDQ